MQCGCTAGLGAEETHPVKFYNTQQKTTRKSSARVAKQPRPSLAKIQHLAAESGLTWVERAN
jgi:hypothetical protein